MWTSQTKKGCAHDTGTTQFKRNSSPSSSSSCDSALNCLNHTGPESHDLTTVAVTGRDPQTVTKTHYMPCRRRMAVQQIFLMNVALP